MNKAVWQAPAPGIKSICEFSLPSAECGICPLYPYEAVLNFLAAYENVRGITVPVICPVFPPKDFFASAGLLT